MNTFVERFQPDNYADWMLGYHKAPHPEYPQTLMTQKEIEYIDYIDEKIIET